MKPDFAVDCKIKFIFADLPLQHVAPKTQQPKYRFVAPDCPKWLVELFCIICKNKLGFVVGCKTKLSFAEESQGGVWG